MPRVTRGLERRLADHVARLADEHPPLRLDDVDFTVVDPVALGRRYGHVLDYMARVELEVDRNVLELTTLLPDPPEVDRWFYADVWQPQEIQHGRILDQLQVELGRSPTTPDTDTVSLKLRLLGALAHLPAFQDVCRMLYYLTGMSTERQAVLAYNKLHDGTAAMGERAVAQTVVAPIKRQEPGHFVFYQLSARGLWEQLAGWQRWLVRRMRTISYGPVGASSDEQRADFGDVMITLGMTADEEMAAKAVRVERELLWAHRQGMDVPPYVLKAFHRAVDLARQRAERSVPD
ncbi:GTP-binding protein LepA [Nocardioides silvaticus]|uniref:GTP-binding protein LepA n=1 Tax=Nocardioides silvaticus TaxID=2201891 RepID=A0A316TGS1_9ACTN|nr:GTP-binding protein LepA [Nocardioides silvaticus]PWN03727.1 GTP-binding protein LepA [Nocardioides silvaticus]